MEWLVENWFVVLIIVAFLAMHLLGHGSHGGHGKQDKPDEHSGHRQ